MGPLLSGLYETAGILSHTHCHSPPRLERGAPRQDSGKLIPGRPAYYFCALESSAWVQILLLSLTSSVILGMSLIISKPKLPLPLSSGVKEENACSTFSPSFAPQEALNKC